MPCRPSENPNLGEVLKYVKDIGIYAVDRPIPSSCIHRTEFCVNCYNNKLYNSFGHMIIPRDQLNELAWVCNDTESLVKSLKRRRHPIERIRLMTRGEAFSTLIDLERVVNILKAIPDTLVWIPTRTWRSETLRPKVLEISKTHGNAKIMASIDPSNTQDEIRSLVEEGWSTMFYGDDRTLVSGNRMFKCPKTHQYLKGHCRICKAGCFSSKQVHVHLEQH